MQFSLIFVFIVLLCKNWVVFSFVKDYDEYLKIQFYVNPISFFIWYCVDLYLFITCI